jgi:uncharacterized protein (TIGR03435 family)
VGKSGIKIHASGDGSGTLGPGGNLSLISTNGSMPMLVEKLSVALRLPVVDKTGLTGGFDFTLDVFPYISDNQPEHFNPELIADAASRAVEAELGLKLQLQKAPVEMLIIDRAEKTPIEN